MSTEHEVRNERRLGRDDFLRLGALTVGTGVLAACGAEGTPEPEPAAQGTTETEERPPIESEPGDLNILEWAGYEYPTLGGKGGPLQPYVDQYGKPKYAFLTSDDQALGKVRAGVTPDIVHPCVSYVKDWVDLGYIQPWDTSLMPNFKDLNPSLVKNAQYEGQQYFVPLDWSFSAPMYRDDMVEPEGGEDTWAVMYDDRYSGKISWWDSPLENFLIWGYVQGFDPYDWDQWTDDVLGDATSYLIEKKKNVRNFWSSEPDMIADFKNGNIWIAYAWGNAFSQVRNADVSVVYGDPKEGRLSWNCGLVLAKDTENYRHAHEYANAWASAEMAAWLIPNYAYGHTNTTVSTADIDPALVEAFKLDDPTALEEPKAHIERYAPDRRRFARAWEEVKAA